MRVFYYNYLEEYIMVEKFNFQKEQYIDFARQMAKKYNLPEDLFLGQLEQESNWNPKAVSHTGAKGIGQFQEQWHPVGTWKFKTKEDYFDPKKSIESSAMYMSSLKNQYKGNYMAALAHYNGGGRQGQLVASGKNPNVPETANYIPMIQKKAAKYGGQTQELQPQILAQKALPEPPQPVSSDQSQEIPKSQDTNPKQFSMTPELMQQFVDHFNSQDQKNNQALQDNQNSLAELKQQLMDRELYNQQANMQAMIHQQEMNRQSQEKAKRDNLLNAGQNFISSLQNIPTNNPSPQINLEYQAPQNYTPKFQMPQSNPWA